MAKPLSWIFQVLDKVSAPSRAMSKALGDVERATYGAAKGIEHTEHATDHAQSRMERFIHTFHDVLHIGEMVGEGLHFLAEKAFDFGKEIFGAIAFHEKSNVALSSILGDMKKAQGVFEDTEDFASKTGISMESLMGVTKQLLVAGFKTDELHVLRNALADVAAVGDPAAMEEMAGALSQVALRGEFGERQLRALNRVGISSQKVFEELGKIYGVTANQAKALVDNKKVDPKAAISALLKAEEATISRGRLGSAAKAQSDTLDALWTRVKMIPDRIFSSLEGGKAHKALSGFLDNVLEVFDPESSYGRHIRDTVSVFFNELIGVPLEDLTGEKGKTAITKFLDDLLGPDRPGQLKALAAEARAFGQDIGVVVKGLADMVRLLGVVFGGGLADRAFEALHPDLLSGQDQIAMAREQLRVGGSPAAIDKARGVLRDAGLAPTSLGASGTSTPKTFAPSLSVVVHAQGGDGATYAEEIARKAKQASEDALAHAFERYAIEGGHL